MGMPGAPGVPGKKGKKVSKSKFLLFVENDFNISSFPNTLFKSFLRFLYPFVACFVVRVPFPQCSFQHKSKQPHHPLLPSAVDSSQQQFDSVDSLSAQLLPLLQEQLFRNLSFQFGASLANHMTFYRGKNGICSNIHAAEH
jgi:hypothetical protein